MTGPTATPTCQTIELHLTGQPDEPYRWGGGLLRPTRVAITTLDSHRSAHLYGTWIRETGEPTNDPCNVLYRHDDTWPDWLTALADEHRPSILIARPGQPAADLGYNDPRADSTDSLRTQRDNAQKQADVWAALTRELDRIIDQREKEPTT